MNHPRDAEMERAMLKRCPFCGGYVQGRAETFHWARCCPAECHGAACGGRAFGSGRGLGLRPRPFLPRLTRGSFGPAPQDARLPIHDPWPRHPVMSWFASEANWTVWSIHD